MNARSKRYQCEIGYVHSHCTKASGRCEQNLMLNPIVQKTVRTQPCKQSAAPPLNWAGVRLAQEGRWHEALKSAGNLLKRYPDHLGAMEVRVRAQLQLGEFEAALLTLRRLIRVNASEAGYEMLRASAMQSMGRLEEALGALHRARSLCRDPRTVANIDSDIQMLAACLGVAESERQIAEIRGFKGAAIPLVH